ncbi:hypothetical protein N657DRAFT_633240 [Parathielavia appendiculata]|uniref:Fibronectin type-III domain-containing protein n=1 Tax=Parathielavia appendiculata TaxID=2587402 RepID=A0AAN6Z3B0_9PEZI|nr:hypothetical protein N657DRAFT_633240 [Parathielavia appendiculata]
MARLAVLAALLVPLQPALASFYTVTSYFALTETLSTRSTRTYTYTDTLTLYPTPATATPTARAVSSSTYINTYYDVEIVSIFVAASDLPSSWLAATTEARDSGVFTNFAVSVTWTAPSSCPTPFTVETITNVNIPNDVEPYLSAPTTVTALMAGMTETYTYYTYILDRTQVPSTLIPTNPTSAFDYSYYVANCRNPTATSSYTARAPNATSGGGGGRYGGGDWSGGDDDDYWDSDWTACSALTGCVALRTWVIVVATLLPAIFLLGFVESYFWFRRMMLGKSALRLGTVCWCLLSLWFILLTRRSPTRSKEDQVLLRQYWKTLGFGTRMKFWFKYGFKWRYPVELLGNPDGNNPVVVVQQQMAVPLPGPGQQGDGAGGGGAEKTEGVTAHQPVYMPYPGQAYMQPMSGQPLPGQQYPGQPYPGQGYVMMAVPPQGPYPGHQPGFVRAPQMGDVQQQQQQQGQLYPPYVPSPSPAQTSTTDAPTMQPTPPPDHHEVQAPPPSGQQEQQQQPPPASH